jgi:hypothetical protein
MKDKYNNQIKYLDKKIENIEFWVGRLTKNDCIEEWGSKLLIDRKMMNEIRDSLKKRNFDIISSPITKIKEKHYNLIQSDTVDKEHFARKTYHEFIDSRSTKEIEKYITILVENDINKKDVIVSANWKDKK